jgi:hypothetical protein
MPDVHTTEKAIVSVTKKPLSVAEGTVTKVAVTAVTCIE